MTESRRKLIAAAFGLDRAPGRAGNMSVATESGCKRRSFAHWTKLSIWKRLTLVSLLFFLVPDAAQAAIQFRAATKDVAETTSLTASKPAGTRVNRFTQMLCFLRSVFLACGPLLLPAPAFRGELSEIAKQRTHLHLRGPG